MAESPVFRGPSSLCLKKKHFYSFSSSVSRARPLPLVALVPPVWAPVSQCPSPFMASRYCCAALAQPSRSLRPSRPLIRVIRVPAPQVILVLSCTSLPVPSRRYSPSVVSSSESSRPVPSESPTRAAEPSAAWVENADGGGAAGGHGDGAGLRGGRGGRGGEEREGAGGRS